MHTDVDIADTTHIHLGKTENDTATADCNLHEESPLNIFPQLFARFGRNQNVQRSLQVEENEGLLLIFRVEKRRGRGSTLFQVYKHYE